MMRHWAAGAFLLIGCRAPESKLPATDVLRFGVGHMGGSTFFVVHSDGTAEYSSSGGPQGSVKVTGKVPPEELEQLAALLQENDFCSNVSTRSTGVPDEAFPSASVRMHGIDCKVSMWDGEFRDDEE
ncbi:MAG: hypothetical protein HOV80_12360, partial [Polyangiaceae bacterium]|nr:hypothetical protein [Polyangiaceae bacterium]